MGQGRHPAYVFGWVRSRDLTDVCVRPPSLSSLSSLKLTTSPTIRWSISRTCSTGRLRASSDFLPGVLAFVGPSLHHLDVLDFPDIESLSTLSAALAQCPSLKVLAVRHSGLLWSGPREDSEPRLPRLEELDLSIRLLCEGLAEPHVDHHRSSWSHLTVLHLQADTDGQFRQSQSAITAILTHASNLREFQWLDERGHFGLDELFPRSYPQTHAWSTQFLRQLPWKDDEHLFFSDKSRTRCVAAFLSVRGIESDVTGERGAFLIEILDREVIAHIFEFIPSRTKRKITVEPKLWWLERVPVFGPPEDLLVFAI